MASPGLNQQERLLAFPQASIDAWDSEHSWHPFTQMQEYATLPQLHIERGEGCWLYDAEGKRYLDGNASIWTNVHGHNDPEMNQAIGEQLGKVAHSTYLGLSHPAGAKLGAKLAAISPEGLDRAIYSDNGSNAIEIALKLSFQYWQLVGKESKQLVVGMEGGYHGDTFGAMSAGNSEAFHGRFAPWRFERLLFPAPLHSECAGEIIESDASASLGALERLLRERGDEIASVILEPWIQGAAGMRLQPKGFLKRVEGLCRKYEAHLILDEVFVAFGRQGYMLVCQEEEVSPDFLCLAKGLTGGYLPLAATLTQGSIYEAFLGSFNSGRGFFHGHTFTGNPLAATAALKSIEKLEFLIDSRRLVETERYFGATLREAFACHANVREVRQRGLAAAIDLCPAWDKRGSWDIDERKGLKVCLAARSRGLLLRPLLDSILLVPPLVISESEIDFLIEQLLAAMESALT